MTNRPTVSVVVPSFNHSRFVAATLESIFRQSLLPNDVLVIDDGSTDDSVSILRRLIERAPIPVRLIARENRGLTKTLNQGIAETNSTYFAYVASDDRWATERLRRGVDALEASPTAVAAYSHCYYIDETDQTIGATGPLNRYVDGDLTPELLSFRSVPLSPTVLYRRSALERIGFNEASRLEDFELYLRLSALGPFRFVPEHLGYWRIHATNTSRGIQMMADERKAAIRRVAPSIGVSEAQVLRSCALSDWLYAADFLSAGERARALTLSIANAWAAPSAESIARRALRLATPGRLHRWHTKRLLRAQARRAAPTSPP